jgi:hypothetical protein
MLNLKNTFSILFLFISISSVLGQEYNGKVIDIRSEQPLAFVTIIFNDNPQLGTSTDIDGNFSTKSVKNIRSLTFSYIGYEQQRLEVNNEVLDRGLLVTLKPTAVRLQEVTVMAGENPAHRIIKQAIKNKNINNPEKVSSFKYKTYNKVVYDFVFNDSLVPDSVQKRARKKLKGGHILIMESVTERTFKSPDENKEVVVGTKVSGFQNPSFAPLATDYQPFSFYEDLITIFDINYLNPISNGSTRKYFFNIEDTLFLGQDTTFIISYRPKKGKNFDGLKGLLYINTNKYAVQNVKAEPAEEGLIGIKIQQKYNFVNGQQWFPEQLNFEIFTKRYPSPKVGMSINGKGYIQNVVLNPMVERKDFGIEEISLDEEASKKDSVFWITHRPLELNKRELVTYEFIDSIGKARNFDKIMYLLEKVASLKVPVSIFDIDLTKTLVFNKWEEYRFGLGLYTNERVSKFFSVGGFLGYGINDDAFKQGAEVIFNIDKNNEVELRLRHQNTLRETGRAELEFFNQMNYDFRSFLAEQMDHIEQNTASIGFRLYRWYKFNIAFNHTHVNPLYDYRFVKPNSPEITRYIHSDITANLRFAFREKIVNSFNTRMSLGTEYPVIFFQYSRGLKGIEGSQLPYNRFKGTIEKSFLTRNFGQSNLKLEAGYIDRALPYGLMFTGEGTFDNELPIYIRDHFHTVAPYEYLSDRYIHLYMSHNFGPLLFRVGKYRPYFILNHNMGWGDLKKSSYHQNIDFEKKTKGIIESGLQIENIIKFRYVNLLYIGFGAGAYYRYGPASDPNPENNVAVKFSMTISTK